MSGAEDLFEEDLLSPATDDGESELLTVKSNEAMESILLETSPLDDSAVTLPTAEPVKPEKVEEKSPDISQYFLAEEAQADPFEVFASKDPTPEATPEDAPLPPAAPESVLEPAPEESASGNSNTVRVRYNSESNREEAVAVPFEETKGQGLKFTQSTKNLSKFFVESPTEGDSEGKEFFDTFAATVDSSPITIPTSSSNNAQTLSTGSSLPPETPPIPSMLHFDPSPLHRVTPLPSLSSQTSVEDAPSTIEASFPDSEDPFSTSLQVSDADRRHDAWIPSEMTRQILVTMANSPPNTFFPEPSHLTMPGIIVEEPLGDPVKDLMVKFLGDAAAARRQTLTAESVTQDEQGLVTLINGECSRAAVQLTTQLLTTYGQGPGKANTPTKHTPESLQMWLVRLSLLMKLRLYSHAEAECQAFGNLDNPDLYYEFYTDSYQGRRGSMVSFDLRVLHAELPLSLGKSQESLDRLHYLHAIITKMLSNLEHGFGEDGSLLELSDQSRQASRDLWSNREIRLLYAIVNCLLNIKDFGTALNVLEKLLRLDAEHKAELLSAIGRIYLQMGDVATAKTYFDKAEKADSGPGAACITALNKGFVALGNNQFSDAYSAFKSAVDLDPKNAVAINNMAVCALYQGRLKDALHVLESLVQQDPATYLQEGVLFNLCTLYELESSRAMTKKQALLELVSEHKGNGFNVACLKMG